MRRKIQSAVCLALATALISTNAHSALTREQQLKALDLRNAEVGALAHQLVTFKDANCPRQTDAQVNDLLNSDFFYTMVAIQNALPEAAFDQLIDETYEYLTCDSEAHALTFVKTRLNIQ